MQTFKKSLLKLSFLALSFMSTYALASHLVVDPTTCVNLQGTAGRILQCPANHVVWQIEDQVDAYGKFETVSCCRAMLPGSTYVRTLSWSAKTVDTQFSRAAFCPAGEVMIGVGFDNSGSAGTMRCARLATARGAYVHVYGVQDYPLFMRGAARCDRDQVAVGLGDHLSPDGNIDALMCASVNVSF